MKFNFQPSTFNFQLFALFSFFTFHFSFSQTPITISGKATDNHGNDCLYQVVVVNQRTSEGTLAGAEGRFFIQALRTDTILVSASGFMVKKLCFRDSANKSAFTITVRLDSLRINLAEVHIYPMRTLTEIHKEENNLGDIPNTDTYKNTDISSPFTYLYERFSRLERSKRKVAQMIDDEQRRNVLKDLFHLYIKYDIIGLSDNDFDAFIDYCNLPDDFIKTATDYELITAIKYRYEEFQKNNSYIRPKQHR